MSDQTQEALNAAVLYALKSGCFFPVPALHGGMTTQEMIQWGAMRNLHTAIAEHFRDNPPTKTPR